MPASKTILTCLLIGFLFIQVGYGQYRFEQPVLIRKEQGIALKDIRSIKKGNDGFMWLGTGEGLCRFDGQQFKVFRAGKDLKRSLFDNLITTVLPVKDKLWLGTGQGISVLNTSDYTFRHYQLDENGKSNQPLTRKHDQHISFLFLDKSGKIWIGTRSLGIFVYDEAKDNFRKYTFSRKDYPLLIPAVGSDELILSIAESQQNDSIIWAGTAAGLQEINKYTGYCRMITFPQKSKDYQVALNAFRRIYQHDDGLLYVGSWAASVNVYDPVAKTFVPLQVKSSEGKKILNRPIGDLFRKSSHEIWINTASGLAIYDTDLKDITWSKFNNEERGEYYGIHYVDESNRVWFADGNGLEYFDPAMQQFSRYSYKHLGNDGFMFAFSVIPDSAGRHITVCPLFTDGIFHLDRQTNTWTKTSFPKNETFKEEKNLVRGFVQLQDGSYVISADRGVFHYSEKTKRIDLIRNGLPVSPTRRGDMLLDHSGNLWLSDDSRGLLKWKPGSHNYKAYNNGLFTVDGYAQQSSNRLVHLYEDSHGNIWFQRTGGYAVYSVARDSLINFVYTQNQKNTFPTAHAFAEDKKGRVWISSDDGLLGYALGSEPEKGIVFKTNIHDKGLSGYFQLMAADPNGEIWSFTSTELVKINIEDLSFTRFNFQYGIPEPDFYYFSFLRSGEMILGGRSEIFITNPSELKRNNEIPVPYISEMLVLNQPIDLLPNGSSLSLTHKQNFFSIGFSAQAYTMAKDVRFRYRLKNFDEWTEVTGRRFANYTNVPGGNYVFQLQAANNEGVWNEKILELPVHIATPWWLTWWFRVALVLLIAWLAWWFYRYRITQIKKKEKLRTQYEKKLANVEMTALLAQMNPHFLFNSLNSIDSYIIKNESKKASEYLNNFARLMRLILQNSRSNYISLKDELETLDLYLQMEGLRFKDKFQYEILVDKEVDTASIVIPPMLIQPYVENAIWHGLMHKKDGAVGKVEIVISKQENNLCCVVLDNGVGREKAEELKAQKSANHKRSMGMQITQDRIEMINKLYNTNNKMSIIDLKDEEGNAKGTKVELIIPV